MDIDEIASMFGMDRGAFISFLNWYICKRDGKQPSKQAEELIEELKQAYGVGEESLMKLAEFAWDVVLENVKQFARRKSAKTLK